MEIISKNEKNTWKDLQFRMYFVEQKEIIEIFSREGGKESVIIYNESRIGENLLKFCFELEQNDFYSNVILDMIKHFIENEKAVGENTQRLMESIYEAMAKNPYFMFLYTKMHNQIEHCGELNKDILMELIEQYENGINNMRKVAMRSLEISIYSNGDKNFSAILYVLSSLPWTVPLNGIVCEMVSNWDNKIYQIVNQDIYDDFTNGKPMSFNINMVHVLYPDSITDIVNYSLTEHIMREIHIKKCKNCGQYFLPSRNNQVEYCDRVTSSNGKTCRQLGASRVYQSKQNKNPIIKEYNKSYKTHNARVRYGIMTKEEFFKWSEEARELRDKCLNGEISLVEFMEWLKK